MTESGTRQPHQVTHVTLTFDRQLADAEVEQLKSKTEALNVRDVLALTREYVGGGVWDYGVDPKNNINASYYWHPDKSHRASVSNPMYGVVRSCCADPGKWASAVEGYDGVVGNNKAFWDVDYCN